MKKRRSGGQVVVSFPTLGNVPRRWGNPHNRAIMKNQWKTMMASAGDSVLVRDAR